MLTNNPKEAFARRLNRLLDTYDFPRHNDGRQVLLAQKMRTSQESTRKWLNGISIPTYERIQELCEIFPCREAWLAWGEEPMAADSDTRALMDLWGSTSPEVRAHFLGILKANRHKP